MKESPFIAVLKRELDRMVSRRIYFASCIVLPLFSIFFMATIFGNGQMENLPVGVVDGEKVQSVVFKATGTDEWDLQVILTGDKERTVEIKAAARMVAGSWKVTVWEVQE